MAARSKLTIYKAKNKLWYWRLKSANGNILADSGEGYDTSSNARRGWTTVTRLVRLFWVKEVADD